MRHYRPGRIWILAISLGLGAHLVGLLLFPPQMMEMDKRKVPFQSLIEFIDLDSPEHGLLAEISLLYDTAPLVYPTRGSTQSSLSQPDGNWLQLSPVSGIEARLLLQRSPQSLPSITRGAARELSSQRQTAEALLRPLNLRDDSRQEVPANALQVTIRPLGVAGVSFSERFVLPIESDLNNESIWSPLELRVWVDVTGSIPAPFILNSTGDDARDQTVLDRFMEDLSGFNLNPGYYSITIGL